jgi:hypothetical protein
MVSGQRQIVYGGPIAKMAVNQYIPTPNGATRSIVQTAIKAQLISFAPSGAGKSVEVASRFGLPNIDVITTNAISAPKNNRRASSAIGGIRYHENE